MTDTLTEADAALNTIWRNEDDGRAVLLRITAGRARGDRRRARGRAGRRGRRRRRPEPAGEPAAAGPTGAAEAANGSQADREAAEGKATPAARTAAPAGKTREGSKQARLMEMLTRPEGATIAQIVEAIGWQPHTVRGAFAGALKKSSG